MTRENESISVGKNSTVHFQHSSHHFPNTYCVIWEWNSVFGVGLSDLSTTFLPKPCLTYTQHFNCKHYACPHLIATYVSENSHALLLPILFSRIYSVQPDKKKKTTKQNTNKRCEDAPVVLKVGPLQ